MYECIEQYERTKRSLVKLDNQDWGSEYDDDLWHFFQDCYHLKDWILNDNVSEDVKNKVEGYIDDHIELYICSNLANRSKHLKLEGRRKKLDAKVTNRNITITPGHARFVKSPDGKYERTNPEEKGSSSCEYIITIASGRKFVAQEVAKKSVALWDEFLKTNGLI